MIECSTDNIYYKRRRKKKSRRFLSVFILFIIVLSIILYYRFVVSGQIVNICEAYSYQFCTESVNSAVLNSMTDSIKYSDLVTVEKNSSGDITLISTNSYKVNYINKEVSEKTEIILKEKIKNGIPIPFLAFSGIGVLSGYGSRIDFKALSVSSVKSDFESEFTSVGINQTHHSVFVTVECEIKVLVPLDNRKVNCKIRVLICESVLLGKVPDVYLKSNLFN